MVYGYCAARVSVRADAEDLTSSVFHRVVDRMQTYDASRGSVRAWVLTIARNALIDHLRRSRRHAPWSEVEDALADARYGPQTEAVDERLLKVRAALAAYPPQVREMFALRYGDGLRTKEIASLLELSEAAVKQRFSRVLRELKRRAQGGELDEEVGYAHS